MPSTAPEHCCGIFVTGCGHRWKCPKCGAIWAWDDDAVEWVPTARNDGPEEQIDG